MLLLTRKVNETVLIGENIRIMVVAIRGKQVRLGIETPPDLLVLRGEKSRQAEPNRAR
ncbi:MAG: carbon storage regulator [Proteobacteria bacterium]|nr:carbon storage regulator [Pseudomonadota bacterium]MBU4355785.1 carbon storage regulator [Pseudomonadota bacterium]MBU4448767.1 carbon storage regulator [Pseudomonadota bacterium]